MRFPQSVFTRILLGTQLASLLALVIVSGQLYRHTHDNKDDYPFLAKRLFLDHPNDIIINFTPLRDQLQKFVDTQQDEIGIYFEYLPTGTSININAKNEFYRASLVKLPVVMRAYKYVEDGKLSLDDILTVETKQLNQEYGDLWKKGAGTTISVRELIRAILINSDNTAFNVLYEKVNVQLRQDLPSGDSSADDIYDYLDIPRLQDGITSMITPKNFTSILKSLYFSSYLSYENSQEILSILTERHQENWLRKDIPSAIRVADKIGVYTAEPALLHVYSDCGIVYNPDRAYGLCVMIKTDQGTDAIPKIQAISQQVFQYIKSQ